MARSIGLKSPKFKNYVSLFEIQTFSEEIQKNNWPLISFISDKFEKTFYAFIYLCAGFHQRAR